MTVVARSSYVAEKIAAPYGIVMVFLEAIKMHLIF
jgi:hypothetical protein